MLVLSRRPTAIHVADPIERGCALNRNLSHWFLTGDEFVGSFVLRNLSRGGGDAAQYNTWGGSAFRTTLPRRSGQLSPQQVTFTGSSDIQVTGPPAMLTGQTFATLTAWAYRASSGTLVATGQGQFVASRFGFLWYSDNKIYCYAENGAASYPNAAANLTGWHHLALVFDGSQTGTARCALYIDGVSTALTVGGSNPGATIADPTSYSFYIGTLHNASASYYFTASGNALDDVRIYPGRALSADDVANLYRDSLAGYRDTLRRVRGRSWVLIAGDTAFSGSASGGMALGGTSIPGVTFAPAPTGGLLLGGTQSPGITFSPTPAGGMALGGTQTPGVTFAPAPSGGIAAGGTASPDVTFTTTASGGMALGGTAPPSNQAQFTATASGGIAAGGTASPAVAFDLTPSGGVAAGGATIPGVSFSPTARGGIALGGTAVVASSVAPAEIVRDYHLLADAVTRLEATGLFDGVYLASPGEYAGQSTFVTLAFVYQTGFAWDDSGTTGDEADVYRNVEYRVAIIARDPDPTRRYTRLDQAGAAASNALSGVRLADATMPATTRLRMGRYVAFPPPLGGLELRGEAQRIVAGYQANDERDDIDDLDP